MNRSGRRTSEPSTRSIAEEFTVYAKLDGLARWRFRRLLRWIRRDPVSVQLLLGLEKELVEKVQFSWQIFEVLATALTWYIKAGDARQENHVPPGRMPEMLKIIILFLDMTPKLHTKYRDLLVHIALAGDDLGELSSGRPGVAPEQFRLEAATVICRIHQYRPNWERWTPPLNDKAESVLSHLLNLAQKADDLQQFTKICQEMAPALEARGYQYFRSAGLEAASALMAVSRDFDEFEGYFARVAAQLKYWRWTYWDIFRRVENASELDRMLELLEAVTQHPLVEKCIRYVEERRPTLSFLPASEVKEAYLNLEWNQTLDCDVIVDGMVELFVQKVVHHELRTIWSGLDDGDILWPFYRFTDYVPYAARNADWTVDSERTRRYWNWQEGKEREFDRFLAALQPRLCAKFRELDSDEFDIVLDLLPNYVRVEEFEQEVEVPVVWQRDVVALEMYRQPTGFYTEELEVARPMGYRLYIFTFDRPNTEEAIDLLDDEGKFRQAIQAHRHSGGSSGARPATVGS